MKKLVTLFTLMCISFVGISQNDYPEEETEVLKSDHIIFDQFGAWKTRHVFDRETLAYKYSDATTVVPVKINGTSFDLKFQFNRTHDGYIDYIIQGWFDQVTLTIDGVAYTTTQTGFHTFYGKVTPALLQAFANTTQPIKIEITVSSNYYVGYISPTGSSAALRWAKMIP